MNYLKIKLGLFSLLAILAVSVFLTSCEQSTIDIPDVVESGVDEQISEIPTLDDMNLPTEEEYPSELIATIQKDGHEIKFHSTGSPENPGIFMQESLYGTALQNQEEYHLAKDEEGTNPFDVFIAVTDTEVSIPKAIANSAKDKLLELSGRKVMETDKSLELLDANYSEEEVEVTFRDCSGDIGYSNFKNWYCKASQSWNINHCGASQMSGRSYWYSFFNYNRQDHRNTRVRVNNTCENVFVYFYSYNTSLGKFVLDKSSHTTQSGNNYFSMWTSVKSYKRLIINPIPGARYRSLVNFVK